MDIRAFQHSLAVKAAEQPDHRFEHLYRYLSREDWLQVALERVLRNTGARTAGIDGMTKKDLETETKQRELIRLLHTQLRDGSYRPSPVKRVYIPKPGKDEKRPLGIPTLTDRIVQESVRMAMEPIWESKFLRCSHGFRPGHRTMDCIWTCYRNVNATLKYFWVIEGDIRKCFDRVNHDILLGLIGKGINDPRLMNLCAGILNAGVMEDGLVGPSLEGTPQGGIVSPLWTNIYLNEFDQWHWNKYTGIPKLEKKKRRYYQEGNAIMTRYADDFIVLTNADHEQAEKMKDEIAEWFTTHLALELNLEKTKLTHATEGWEFLGFHLEYRPERANREAAWLQVVPSQKSIHRVRDKIRELTSYRGRNIPEPELFMLINAIIRGWANYYRFVNSAKIFAGLDWWLNDRVIRRIMRHRMIGITEVINMFKRRQTTNSMKKACNRWNLKAGDVWLMKASDIKIRRYYPTLENWQNPYRKKDTPVEDLEEQGPMIKPRFTGLHQEDGEWLELRRKVLLRDNYTCQECGSQDDLEVHHRKGRISNGKDSEANCVTLCKGCHQKRTNVQMASKRKTNN